MNEWLLNWNSLIQALEISIWSNNFYKYLFLLEWKTAVKIFDVICGEVVGQVARLIRFKTDIIWHDVILYIGNIFCKCL